MAFKSKGLEGNVPGTMIESVSISSDATQASLTSIITKPFQKLSAWLLTEQAENKPLAQIQTETVTTPKSATAKPSVDPKNIVRFEALDSSEQIAALNRAIGTKSLTITFTFDDSGRVTLSGGDKVLEQLVGKDVELIDLSNQMGTILAAFPKIKDGKQTIPPQDVLRKPLDFKGLDNVQLSFAYGNKFHNPKLIVDTKNHEVAEATKRGEEMYNLVAGMNLAKKMEGIVGGADVKEHAPAKQTPIKETSASKGSMLS